MITEQTSQSSEGARRWVGGPAVLVAAVVALTFGFGASALAASGDLDPSFGTGGKVTTLFPDGSYANAVAIQPDGKIVAVGAAAGSSDTGEFAVARYETDGSLDPTFSGDGILTTPIAGGGDEARSVAIQPNGKIVVAGTDSRQRFAVVRYLSDGTLDPSFSGNGIARANLTPFMDIGYDVAIQPDGKIVVAGVEGGPYSPYFAVLRYRHDGSLDPTFANGGKAILVRNGVARSLVIQPDGKIVVTGYTDWGLTVARLLPDGRRDRSFGGDGVVGRLSGPGQNIWPLAVALQANGKIVVAGDYDIFHAGVARFTAAGKLDMTFGGDGVVRVSLAPSGEQGFVGLAIQTDGRIVAAGHVQPHEGSTPVPRIVVARFLRDGSLDDTWGGNGKVSTRFPGGAGCDGVALQADEKIVVAGQATSPWSFALVRYMP